MKRVYWLLGIFAMGLMATEAVSFANGPGRNKDFTFARVEYDGGGRGGFFGGRGRGRGRGGWAMDFDASDRNMIRMLQSITTLQVNEPQSIRLDDPNIFDITFLYILEVGGLNLSQGEAENLREYLLRGGFMMVDDFHGSYEWSQWQSQIVKVFPDRHMERIPDDHPVLHCYFDFDKYPLVPGTAAGAAWGGKYERDGAEYGHRAYGIFDDDGRLMMLINWNTDIGDGWEWAAGMSSWGESYPRKYAEVAYKLGVNYAVYAMTH